jgi:CSLREA domain-containing protein
MPHLLFSTNALDMPFIRFGQSVLAHVRRRPLSWILLISILIVPLAVALSTITGLARSADEGRSVSRSGHIGAARGMAMMPVTAALAAGATITVNSAEDVLPVNGSDGKCTLREAITAANTNTASGNVSGECAAGSGDDAIIFDATIFDPGPNTINLKGVLPDLASNITITGPGSSKLTVRRDTGGVYRIFFTNGFIVTISGMTVANGRTADGAPGSGFGSGGSGGNGGGIAVTGDVTLRDLVITGNSTGNGGPGGSGGSGGFGGFGGGISAFGNLTMTNVTVSNNTTGNGGTGNSGGSGGRGGGISVGGQTLTMTNCIVTGNTNGNAVLGTSGSGGSGGGILASSVTVNLTNVQISNNTAGDAVGSGTGGLGGGLMTESGVTSMIVNSTISNNSAGQGGSGFAGQGGYGGY